MQTLPYQDANKAAMKKRILFRFRLYIAGQAQNSILAVANLTALCRTHLSDHCEIEVVDVFHEPERALEDGVFLTPTLIKLLPMPVKCIVGSLSHMQTVLLTLGLESRAP